MSLALTALIVILLMPFMAVFVARPLRTVLPLYAATLPIASVVRLSVPIPAPFNTLSSLLGGLTIVAGVCHIILYRRGRAPTLPVGMWMLFLAWAAVSSFWALSLGSALDEVVLAVALLSLLVVVSLLPAEELDLDVLRLAIIFAGIAVGLYALVLIPSGALPTHGVTERLSVASDPQDTNPNILAASLLLPAALSLERLILGGKRWFAPRTWRLIGGSGLFLSTVAILFTGSRGGLLACFIAMGVVIQHSRRLPGMRAVARKAALGIAGALTLVLALGAAIMAAAPSSSAGKVIRSETISRITRTTDDGSGRLQIWAVGGRACMRYCALGAGFGNFPEAYTEAFVGSDASTNVGLDRPAHNVFLSLAVETGLVGITLFGLALLLEYVSLRRPSMQRIAPGLGGAVVAILVAEIFLSAIWFKYFWLVFLLIRVAEGVAARQSDPLSIVAGGPRAVIAEKPA
jgi:O-antigen ligase